MMLSGVQWAALACVLGMTFGQVMFKVSALSVNETGSYFAPRTFMLLGFTFAIYFLVSFGWVWILRKAQLGQIFPFMALAYALVPLASYYFFGERFNTSYYLGTLLIIAGLLLCMRT